MRAFFRHSLILLCALHISGVHWLALQTAAWTGMLVARSMRSDVETAVRTTFDGQHPCRLCKAVRQARDHEQREEQRSSFFQQIFKIDLVAFEAARLAPPGAAEIDFIHLSLSAAARGTEPPKQPPRAA